MADEKTYSVGYKRPPAHTRFKPGQSGNPQGRKPGTQNLKTDLAQELAERIPVREGERRLKVSKQRAILKALVSAAIKGNTKAATTVLQLVATTLLHEEGETETMNAALPQEELEILDRYVARRLETSQGIGGHEDDHA